MRLITIYLGMAFLIAGLIAIPLGAIAMVVVKIIEYLTPSDK